MFIVIYRFFSNFLLFFIGLFFFIRLIKSKETRKSFFEKFALYKISRPQGKLIWINAVSIGESKSAITVANAIIKKNPKVKILFTSSTISSYKLISRMKNNFFHFYAPLDINFIVKRFLNSWKPDLAIFIESEIWPNIIYSLKEKNIKFAILNARISINSFNVWKKTSFFSKEIFNSIDLCIPQDLNSKKRFSKLGAKNVTTQSNLKFLSQKLDFDQKQYLILNNKLKTKKIITLFSCHETEDILFINSAKKLMKKYKNLFFVIIPRHINKSKVIQKNFVRQKVTFAVRSVKKDNIDNKNFYLVDTFGELGLFFKLSHIALVGGSFVSKGGHNPIETSHFNCALIFGPHMENFKDISKNILKNNAGFMVKDSNALEKKISLLLENQKIMVSVINNFNKMCENEKKKSQKILKKIDVLLNNGF